MKIIDCFMYYDEDNLLDLRLNILNKYVDKFIIVESKFSHSGNLKSKNFDIENFKEFKNKIDYYFIENEPNPENWISKFASKCPEASGPV